ncbi:kinase-like domain-containing protein [Aspergillus granulosus]|uniref:Altered inheritance of mitochondria protein 9, mitochondrial n=1 Tax=Aspergillus granulosus TaxID=176169 RepID=A0ABR4I312_9EURO
MRKFRELRQKQQVARMSIVCRGKPISREELFTYTNGRFLVNEEHQFARRYRQFDLDALCNIVATAGGSTSRITDIEKLEGGFSKALLMTKEDGTELIAKVPCRIAGPAFLTTASEVGTLEYIRKYTNIPVPRVFSWSSDDSNPVRAEYIVMEKAIGVPLFERWGTMAEVEKLELIKHLTEFEAQLSAISFPAYGGIYLRADADRLRYQNLGSDVDKQHLFCIGPSPDRSFDADTVANITTGDDSVNNGPCKYLMFLFIHTNDCSGSSLSDFGISIVKREFSRIAKQSPDNQLIAHWGSAQEQAHLLETTIILMRMLDSHPILAQFAQPTLWHTDLHMGNIFVAPNNNSQITALIDIQSLSVLPLFLQTRWPVFLQPPRDYTRGLVQPVLPGDFDSLNEDDKAAALHEWTQAKLAKAYEVSTFLENRLAHNAMTVPRVFRELFIRVGDISDVGVVPLRECLVEIFQNWSNLGFSGHCPYFFSQEEVNLHERQFAKYQEWNEAQQLAQESLDTDAEGWIAPQLDVSRKRSQNKELLSMYMTRMVGEMSAEEARRIWPFPE